MAATDLERLVVQLEAQSQKLDNQIAASAANIDKRLGEIEKRTDLMRSRVENSFAAAGANAVKKFTNALLASGAFIAIDSFIKSIIKTAEDIKHTSDAIGVSATNLQSWGIQARKAGVDAEQFNAGLERFTKNFGSAKEGNKQLTAEFQRLGINIKGNVTDAFLKYADVMKNTTDQSARVAITTALFGRNIANLVPFLAQGRDHIEAVTAALKEQGRIMSDENIAKIDEMVQKWEDLKGRLQVVGATALVAFFDEFSKFTGDIESPQFQAALANFAKALADAAAWAAKLAPFLPAIAGAFVGSRVAGAPGAVIGGIIGGTLGAQSANAPGPVTTSDQMRELEIKAAALAHDVDTHRTWIEGFFGDSKATQQKLAELDALKKKIAEVKAEAGVTPTPKGGFPQGKGAPSNVLAPVGADQSARLAAEAQQRADAIARLQVEQARANEAQIAADDQLHVRMLQGLAGYHDAVVKEIDDELAAKTNQINQEEQAAITALGRQKGLKGQELQDELDSIHAIAAARRAAADANAQLKLFEASGAEIVRSSIALGEDQIRGYDTEIKTLGLLGGALARAQFLQDAYNKAKAQGIPLTEEYVNALNAEADRVAAAAQAAHDAGREMADQIQLADELRNGLADVFAAGLHGWKAMESAAANFLQTIAEMILKIYVLKPLLEGMFGEQGTPLGGGGGGGGIFSSIFDGLFSGGGSQPLSAIPADVISSSGFFAKGGVTGPHGRQVLKRFASGGVADTASIFAESGIEAAVPLPDGRTIPVTLRLPRPLSGTPQRIIVNQTVHADRSILADDVMRQIERSKQEAITAGSVKGANVALKGVPGRQQNFKRLGT